MKDLSVLAEGMKRAKNIKEESRYYFTQGVLLHNIGQYMKAVEYFEKFMKIVIYLQDLKSVELGLNVIGAAYMLAGEYRSTHLLYLRSNIIPYATRTNLLKSRSILIFRKHGSLPLVTRRLQISLYLLPKCLTQSNNITILPIIKITKIKFTIINNLTHRIENKINITFHDIKS